MAERGSEGPKTQGEKGRLEIRAFSRGSKKGTALTVLGGEIEGEGSPEPAVQKLDLAMGFLLRGPASEDPQKRGAERP